MKYVLVSGGVISGVGKGIIASSTGLLLKSNGLKVTFIKIDPYLNVDAGTMNPKEHGEVFVLDDGGEADLDLGNYERYLNIRLTRDNNITTGKIYQHVIEAERQGKYLGKTVQVVPHVTSAITEWIERVARIPTDGSGEEPDVCVIELGGTIGDIESSVYFEALSALRLRVGKHNFATIHVSYVIEIHGEQKSRPTQQSVRHVASAGLSTDLVVCRCQNALNPGVIAKVANACGINPEQVMGVRDLPSIYQVPGLLKDQGLDANILSLLEIDAYKLTTASREAGLDIWNRWNALACPLPDPSRPTVTIALVGKYVEANDAYLSVIKSLEHSSMKCVRNLKINWIDSSDLEDGTKEQAPEKHAAAWSALKSADGVLVPGGFGYRGTEGMILAAKYAREEKVPYLGVCLGMQVAVIEYARSVCGLADATSEEFSTDSGSVSPDAPRAIVFMPEIDKKTMGGNMRLGARVTAFQPGSEWSKMRAVYAAGAGAGASADSVLERHRHRYEVCPDLVGKLQAGSGGLAFIGKDESGLRMEILEIRDHPWFVAVQYHPEYLSRVLSPSKPYLGFVAASAGMLQEVIENKL